MPGLTIRTFLTEGNPDGLKTMELSNRTVIATWFPRPSLDLFLKRHEANRPGIYILIGPDEDSSDGLRLYIGEGDPVSERLRSHGTKRDFWESAIAFTSKDDYLTKTQIQYLEARLVQLTKQAARAKLDNVQAPTLPAISKPDEAESEDFLSLIALLLRVSGYNFHVTRQAEATTHANVKERFAFQTKGATAYMVRTSNGYVVTAGSQAVAEPPSYGAKQEWVVKLRNELIESQTLTKAPDGLLRFSVDTKFTSPTAAGAVVAGGGVNGRTCWKLEDGRLLKDVEDAEGASEDPLTSRN